METTPETTPETNEWRRSWVGESQYADPIVGSAAEVMEKLETERNAARLENAEMRDIIYEVSTGGYTPMQAHEWLKSTIKN